MGPAGLARQPEPEGQWPDGDGGAGPAGAMEPDAHASGDSGPCWT